MINPFALAQDMYQDHKERMSASGAGNLKEWHDLSRECQDVWLDKALATLPTSYDEDFANHVSKSS